MVARFCGSVDSVRFLSAARRRLTAATIVMSVRSSEHAVHRRLKRYPAEGAEGLRNMLHPGASSKASTARKRRLTGIVRCHTRSLRLPFALWTLQRLPGHMVRQTVSTIDSYDPEVA
jgi:hypothetical protein